MTNEQTCSRQCLAEKVPFGSKLYKIGSDLWGIPVISKTEEAAVAEVSLNRR